MSDPDAGPLPADDATVIARETVVVPVGQIIVLTNEFTTQFGVGHPENTGTCRLSLNGLDASGNPIPGGAAVELVLAPGESADVYLAPDGAVAIGVGAFADCGPGGAQLTYDTPVG